MTNDLNLDYRTLEKLMDYNQKENEGAFVAAYNIYRQSMEEETFKEGFRELFLLRHQALKEVNSFLSDEDQERIHQMDEDDKEGWQIYKVSAERYRIYDFFFTRLLKHINDNQIGLG